MKCKENTGEETFVQHSGVTRGCAISQLQIWDQSLGLEGPTKAAQSLS